MSGQKGERLLPFELTAAAQLERYRAVKITAGVPAYPGYGDEVLGVTRVRGDANDFAISVEPLSNIRTTFFLELGATVAANALLFAFTTGKAKAADYTALSRSLPIDSAVATEGNIYIVPSGIDWAGGSHQNKKAVRGASAWTYTAATAGDVVYVADEGVYVQWSGTAWVQVSPFAVSGEAGASGEIIACRVEKEMSRQSRYLKPSAQLGGFGIIVAGHSASETDADAEVVISDNRILDTDVAVVNVKSITGTIYALKAVCTARTLTVTLSGNGGAGTIISYAVIRPTSD